MRKSYKKKERSCPLCKPHKMGIEKRWKPKDYTVLRQAERDMRLACNGEEVE